MNDYCPLVSVCVIAYNSSEFILETLNSIKDQTYQNIELIISDDRSKDNTVEVCRKWIQEYGDRFARVEVLVAEKNGGISANVNKACKAAKGEWIKSIAGDDMLLSNCISDYISYCEKNNAEIVFSKIGYIGNNTMNHSFDYHFFDLSANEQLNYLIKIGNPIPAPTSFLKRAVLERLNFFDERIPFIEDYPFWIKALKFNIILSFLNKETVLYRVHEGSISLAKVSKKFLVSRFLVFKYYVFGELVKTNPCYAIDKYILSKSKSYIHPLPKVGCKVLRLFSPYFYYRIFKKIGHSK